VNLDMVQLISLENERKTEIGQEYSNLVAVGKNVQGDIIVRMLRKCIFSGAPKSKFILSGFPEIIDHVKEFEQNCAPITAVIYATADDPVVEIKASNIDLFNIDSLFQKKFRLKTMTQWDPRQFEELIGSRHDYIFIQGQQLTGKTTVAKMLKDNLGFEVFDFKKIDEDLKKKLGSEDEPLETVPTAEFQKYVFEILEENKKRGLRKTWVLDSFVTKEADDVIALFEMLDPPSAVITCFCSDEQIENRFKAQEDAPEVTEEVKEQFAEEKTKFGEYKDRIFEYLARNRLEERVQMVDVDTERTLEATARELKRQFAP